MQPIKKIYRANYAGENVITNLNLVDGEWDPTVEYVPNRVINTHSSTQAVAIGNGTSRLIFDLKYIAMHTGGLLATDKFQSYGCNALYRDFRPDFLVAVGDTMIEELVDWAYWNGNIVYVNATSVLKYPGKFYLIPQNLSLDAGALAAYLAAFDGHRRVYLLGYDQYDEPAPVNNVYTGTRSYPGPDTVMNGEFLALSLANVVKTYNETEFIRVMPTRTYWLHNIFKPLPNFRQISYKDFVLEADIG